METPNTKCGVSDARHSRTLTKSNRFTLNFVVNGDRGAPDTVAAPLPTRSESPGSALPAQARGSSATAGRPTSRRRVRSLASPCGPCGGGRSRHPACGSGLSARPSAGRLASPAGEAVRRKPGFHRPVAAGAPSLARRRGVRQGQGTR